MIDGRQYEIDKMLEAVGRKQYQSAGGIRTVLELKVVRSTKQ